MGRVQKLIEKFEKFVKNTATKKPKHIPQKKQPETQYPMHWI